MPTRSVAAATYVRDSILNGAVPVATRNGTMTHNLSNGTDTGGTFDYQHTAIFDFAGMRLVYANWNSGGDGANAITVRAGINFPSLGFVPVWFNGKRDVVIDGGGTVVSDPIEVDVPLGYVFHTRSYVTVASAGQKWPLGLHMTVGGASEGDNRSASPVDLTLSGSLSNSDEFGYNPLVVLGTAKGPSRRARPVVALVGDSVMFGTGDGTDDSGFGRRAFRTNPGGSNPIAPTMMIAHPGEISSGLLDIAGRRRLGLIEGCSHVICQYGVNDVNAGNSVGSIQTNLTKLWNSLTDRGMQVWQTTLTPHEDFSGAKATVRATVNDWIRTKPAPLAGYIDIADVVESARNSNLYNPTYNSGDGIHPNTAGHTAIAAVVPTASFT